MPKDPTVQVAIVGVLTTLITTFGVIVVALLNNKKERGTAADEGITATLRERITLRDEQLTELRDELGEVRTELAAARDEVRRLREQLSVQKGQP